MVPTTLRVSSEAIFRDFPLAAEQLEKQFPVHPHQRPGDQAPSRQRANGHAQSPRRRPEHRRQSRRLARLIGARANDTNRSPPLRRRLCGLILLRVRQRAPDLAPDLRASARVCVVAAFSADAPAHGPPAPSYAVLAFPFIRRSRRKIVVEAPPPPPAVVGGERDGGEPPGDDQERPGEVPRARRLAQRAEHQQRDHRLQRVVARRHHGCRVLLGARGERVRDAGKRGDGDDERPGDNRGSRERPHESA
mmetsp:Transcript_4588/g.19587  ORF Transcript_4588/g.19587 Transcript_4588/m.19587 type:complete len:249 (+) Transcript_4588:1637-2383(+)